MTVGINKFKHLTNEAIDSLWGMSLEDLEQKANQYIAEIQREDVPFQLVQDDRPIMIELGGHTVIKRGSKVFIPRKNGGEFEIPESEIPQYWSLIYVDEYETYLELMSIFIARNFGIEGGSRYCVHYIEDLQCVHCGAALKSDNYAQEV